jgi:hypothetical protein
MCGSSVATASPIDENVTIRSTALAFDTWHATGALVIRVPASSSGYRLSVEFADDLFTHRSSGNGYTVDGSREIVGVAPCNALLHLRQCIYP